MTFVNLTSLDDSYTAGTAGDVINGLAGNDTLRSSSGGNELRGGDGNDVLYGGAGDDTLEGDDSTNFTYHNTLQGGGGNDVIVSNSFYDQVLGGSGDDFVATYAMTTGQGLDGGTGQDTINIQALRGGTHSVYLNFGSVFTPVVDGINGASCSNFEVLEFIGGTGPQTISGGAGDDTIYNSPSNIASIDAGTLAGRSGNDLIGFSGLVNPGTGTEQAFGGAGTDTLAWSIGTGKATTLAIDAKAGTIAADGSAFASFNGFEQHGFTIYDNSGVQTLTLNGSKGVDQFQQSIAASPTTAVTQVMIKTFGGNDVIHLGQDSGTVDAGGGNDFIGASYGNTGELHLLGRAGNDTIRGDSAATTLMGGGGNDSLSSYELSRSLGGAGNDTLELDHAYGHTGPSASTLNGGAGHDSLIVDLTYSTNFAGSPIHANFAHNAVTLSDGTKFLHFEAVDFTSSSGDDRLHASNDAGGATANILAGGSGNDTLIAGSHGAALNGGFGNDTLVGGAGADALDGESYGIGFDFASYANAATGVRADLGNAATNTGDAAGDSYHSIEGLIGSDRGDKLLGDSGDNQLTGGRGNDLLSGRGGNDILIGGGGRDHLNGGAGNDELNGGAGNDVLSGNNGHDTFVFADGFGHDTISHFASSNLEKVDLSAVTAITGFNNLVDHHLFDDPGGSGYALIDDGAGNTILLDHVAKSDIGAGQIYSAADFIV